MKKLALYAKTEDNRVMCLACNHHCHISDTKTGICGIRQNQKGDLHLLTYGKAIAANIDPIEKKPLFHFLPGTEIFSLGTYGCNFGCDFCQNFDISQATKRNSKIGNWGQDWSPNKIVQFCKNNHIPNIAYTYNEPTIWVEYALDIMKLAKDRGLKNVWVSNGYMSKETLDLIAPYLDAINIDLKSISNDFYIKYCKAKLEPVKNNIKDIWQRGIWEEITTLIIPSLNDSDNELKQIAEFIYGISHDLIWHISAFYPAYKMMNRPPTPLKTLLRAYEIGREVGLKYVYTGNVPNSEYESTYCPKCNELLIKRLGMAVLENHLNKDKCHKCNTKISGVWN